MRGHLRKEQRLQQVITRLKNENVMLRERVTLLEKENTELKTQLQNILMQMEELKVKVFGKKRRGTPDDDTPHLPPLPRAPHTYRRPIPADGDVTAIKEFSLTQCAACHTPLKKLKTVIRYVEDMLPPAQWHRVLKVVEKHQITMGWCSSCKKWISAIPLSKHLVTIGANVKQFTTYAEIILRLSFDQIKGFLSDTIRLSLSDGEIAHILDEHARTLTPEAARIGDAIRAQSGAHYDETGWKVQAGEPGNYGWVMTGVHTPDTVFLLGRSRGKGNAEELKGGAPDTQIGISDDYGAYKTLFLHHQLCWAHPLRKLRELKDSAHLSSEQKDHCRAVYERFAALYEDVRAVAATPFISRERLQNKELLISRFLDLAVPHIRDPVRLAKIKLRLRKQHESYFTCLTAPGIPPDNNKAERALRHLVLKRKNCYGSKTQKGAETMGALFSVLLSLWWKKPKNFFAEFSRLLNPQTT